MPRKIADVFGAVACVLALAGCGGAGSLSGTSTRECTSGIEGYANVGPIVASGYVVAGNEMLFLPLSNAVVTVHSCVASPGGAALEYPCENGDIVGRATSDSQGRFRIPLPPGRYVVIGLPPNPNNPLPGHKPEEVIVLDGQFLSILVHYDTSLAGYYE